MVDLMFRDESSHVIKKAKAKQRKKSANSPDSESSPDTDSWTTMSVTPEPRATTTATTTITTATTKNHHQGVGGLSLLTPNSQVLGAGEVQSLWSKTDDNILPSPDAGSWPSTPLIARMYNLEPTCQERGTAYFFSRFVTLDENACHQRFDFIYDIWKPTSLMPERQLDGVMASMTAVGLVGVANLTHSKEVMDGARKSYGTALRLTNAALRNPKEAAKDTTMLSILILGLFEMMTGPSAKSMQAWHEHVNGAAVLAKMRGPSQFRTRSGVRMFMMLCQSVMILCIQKEMPMPQVLVDLRNELAGLSKTKKKEPGLEISLPIYKVLQARYEIKTGKLADTDELLARLNEIEAEFERVIDTFPDAWRFRSFRLAKPHKPVYRDVCHLYPSLWVATVWNGLRGVRILILESILAELQRRFRSVDPELIPPRYLDEADRARAKLELIMAAIVASVPQHFGLLNPLDNYLDTLMPISTTEVREPPTPPADSPADSSTTASEHDDWTAAASPDDDDKVTDDSGPTLRDPTRARNPEEEAERFMLLASATNTIVWPLYSTGMSSICTPAMKEYVVERLMAIFYETGLAQAKSIASIVRSREISSSQWIRMPREGGRRSWSDVKSRVKLPV